MTFKEPSPNPSQGSPMHQSPLNSPEITVVSETPAPISISDDNEDDPTNTEVPETQAEQTAPASGNVSQSDDDSVLDDFNTVHVISPLSQQDSQAAPESFTQGSPMDLGIPQDAHEIHISPLSPNALMPATSIPAVDSSAPVRVPSCQLFSSTTRASTTTAPSATTPTDSLSTPIASHKTVVLKATDSTPLAVSVPSFQPATNVTPMEASTAAVSVIPTSSDIQLVSIPATNSSAALSAGDRLVVSRTTQKQVSSVIDVEQQQRVTLNGLLYRSYQEIRDVLSPEFFGNVASAKSLEGTQDLGAALFTVGTTLHGLAQRLAKQCLESEYTFSIQLVYFSHSDESWIAYCLWIPLQPTSVRIPVQCETLTKFFARVSLPICAESEKIAVTKAVSDFLKQGQASAENLAMVTCSLAPGSWSVYVHEGGDSQLQLQCVVPAELRGGGFLGVVTARTERVLQFLETFASLCCEDSYLSNVLSSCGISFANLPARESILFWPFVGRATEILQSRYVAICEFLNSGGVATDSTVGRLVNELDSARFRSHCRYLHALIATVAEKIVELAEAVDLSGTIVVLVDLLNWFQDQLTTDGPASIPSVCWPVPFSNDGTLESLPNEDRCPPCVQGCNSQHLGLSDEEFTAESRKTLLALRAELCGIFSGLLLDPVCRILYRYLTCSWTVSSILKSLSTLGLHSSSAKLFLCHLS